jgi:hypothetical protein
MADGYLRVYQQIIRQAKPKPQLAAIGAPSLVPESDRESAVA